MPCYNKKISKRKKIRFTPLNSERRILSLLLTLMHKNISQHFVLHSAALLLKLSCVNSSVLSLFYLMQISSTFLGNFIPVETLFMFLLVFVVLNAFLIFLFSRNLVLQVNSYEASNMHKTV